MKINVIGLEFNDYTNKDGRHIRGVNVHYDSQRVGERFLGVIPAVKWFGEQFFETLEKGGLGAYDAEFNPQGYPQGIRKL